MITLYNTIPVSATLKPMETVDKRVTSWLPLTSNWNLPSGCSTSFHINAAALTAFDPGYGLEGDPLVRCVPPEIVASSKQAALGQPDTSISLGPLTCPDYLYTAGISVKDGSSTLAVCCPSYVHPFKRVHILQQLIRSKGVHPRDRKPRCPDERGLLIKRVL